MTTANIKFWSEKKVKQKFIKLCDGAKVNMIDWKKFRQLDKKMLFKDFSDYVLSMKFRNIRLREVGLCYSCGKSPAISKSNGMCKKCFHKGATISK